MHFEGQGADPPMAAKTRLQKDCFEDFMVGAVEKPIGDIKLWGNQKQPTASHLGLVRIQKAHPLVNHQFSGYGWV